MSMRNPWRQCTLGDLISVKHGYPFLGEHFADAGSHIVLTPGNFIDSGGFKAKVQEKWYRGPIPEEYVLKAGDLLVAMTEQAEGLLGSSALIPNSGLYLHNQRLGLIEPLDPSTDKRFLYYLFNLRAVRTQIRGSASGTKIRHTSPSRICEVKVEVPAIDVQRRIADILSAYDDLIDNSQRRIRILEDMARRLYREWFVHFRFPGADSLHRIDSPLGPIPQGWQKANLEDVCVSIQTGPFGSQLHESDYAEEGAPVVMPKDLIAFRINPAKIARIPEETAARLQRHRLTAGDIVYGRRGDIGRRAFVMAREEGWLCGTGCLRVRPNTTAVNGWFLFNYLGQADVADLIAKRAHGATMPNLNTKLLATVPLALPPRDLQDAFAARTLPLAQMRELHAAKIENLRRTRDLLLPRLLSGELAVTDLRAEEPTP
jgi:type I restriction enzyme S subunit